MEQKIIDVVRKFADANGVPLPNALAFIETEGAMPVLDSVGRPLILPEKHVFHRNLPKNRRALALKKGLASTRWTRANYKGLGGGRSLISQNNRWDLLKKMEEFHERAGPTAASYGIFQVLGENWKSLGFSSPKAFQESQFTLEGQVSAAFTYLKVNKILDDLIAWDVHKVCRVWNGPAYRKNNYHIKMINARNRWIKNLGNETSSNVTQKARGLSLGSGGRGAPENEVERVLMLQELLISKTHVRIKADGDFGPATHAALVAFQVSEGLEPNGLATEKLITSLRGAPKARQTHADNITPRDEITVKDIRKSGSQTVKGADNITAGGIVVGAGGAIAATKEILVQVEAGKEIVDQVAEMVPDLIDTTTLVILAALIVGGGLIWSAYKIKQARLNDERDGTHIGRT